ncbi:group I truncated hemoglobin [Phaeacidiphilus oryzae]|uniref:group I truncated hemoglobin n=1 Tax=Phaeacidiphilus oryzae TaxID=348818 RepID=UPI00068A032D|nr:group 1 truncated hemoglobin [Phaeacidiphilus oryzae]
MSIYEEIGGAPALAAAVDEFYQRVLGDPELSGYFEGVELARLKGHQRAFLAAALGGSELYAGRPLGEAHRPLGVQPAHFDRVVTHLADTLTSLSVPQPTIDLIAGKLAPLKAEIAPDRTPTQPQTTG